MVVVGHSDLAAFVVAGLAAMGLGQLIVIDASVHPHTAWFAAWSARRDWGDQLVDFVRSFSDDVRAVAMQVPLLHGQMSHFIPNGDIVVDATDDPHDSAVVGARAASTGARLIRAQCGPNWGACSESTHTSVLPVPREPQPSLVSPIESLVVAALVCDEVRRIVHDREPRSQHCFYCPAHHQRFSSGLLLPDTARRPAVGCPRALLVGAGGLGTFAGLGLALAGWGLTIIDPDVVSSHNLNRQILYGGEVGQPKATVLVERLRRVGGGPIEGWVGTLEQQPDLDVDVVLCCVDGYATRAFANQWARRRRMPLINGGASALQGNVEVYVPGRTACLSCQIGIDALAQEDANRQACGESPVPSTVLINQLIGALMAAECQAVIDASSFGEPLASSLLVDVEQPWPFRRRLLLPSCKCHEVAAC